MKPSRAVWTESFIRREWFTNRSQRTKFCKFVGENKESNSLWIVFECSSSFPANLLRNSEVKNRKPKRIPNRFERSSCPPLTINGSKGICSFPVARNYSS
ncbi:hypothetical protein AVEN_213056-1 [Araneus ventricosus]|uniref:Uncharacterized protein n=1 Tax=Araneus ventricosus TaxID=182803 RepID=A0A4Y2QPF4_ARAVE|nr:hypothetical protein AVEN_213056-1 [Araneus ventricosus]